MHPNFMNTSCAVCFMEQCCEKYTLKLYNPALLLYFSPHCQIKPLFFTATIAAVVELFYNISMAVLHAIGETFTSIASAFWNPVVSNLYFGMLELRLICVAFTFVMRTSYILIQ